MKKIFLIALLLCTIAACYCQSDNVIANYISRYKEIAMEEQIRTGVPASISLAQGIQETGAGQSDLVKQSNNHFGIKCKSDWTGKVVYHDDDEKAECFRSYTCAEDSYRDHSNFLRNRQNYSFLFTINPADYEGWAKGLKKAGYATESDYAPNLIKMITSYHLQDYTLLAAQRKQSNMPGVEPNNAALAEGNAETPNGNSEKAIPVKAMVGQTIIDASTMPYPSGVFSINNTKVVYVQQGTSLFALASKYNIALSKLLQFNELQSETLDKNSLIFLAKKEKKGAKQYHVVTAPESLPDVAQAEGVCLENLCEYNSLAKDANLQTGQKIYLQEASSQ